MSTMRDADREIRQRALDEVHRNLLRFQREALGRTLFKDKGQVSCDVFWQTAYERQRALGAGRQARETSLESIKSDDNNDDGKELQQDPQVERIALSEEEPRQTEPPSPPLLDDFRHVLQTCSPVLYAQVLEPTLADLREEHSAAIAEGHPIKARCVLLRGCGSLVVAALCQFSFNLLGRIAALWKAKSPK